MQSQGSVTENIIDGVSTISFMHPQANSLPLGLLKSLAAGINDASNNKSIQVIHLKSEGSATFCAGASFDELSSIKSESAATEVFMGFADVMLAIVDSPKPVVLSAPGKAVGGGVGLIAAADWVVAEPGSQVRLSELSLGIGPFTISPTIIRKIGLPAFQELSYSNAWKDAVWCQQKGLFNTVASSVETLTAEAHKQIEVFKCFDPDAFTENKKLLTHHHQLSRDEFLLRAKQVSLLLLAPYAQEKIKHIKNKKT